jgi:hypothetical protein
VRNGWVPKKIIVDNFPNVKFIKITHGYVGIMRYTKDIPYPDLPENLLELHFELQNVN